MHDNGIGRTDTVSMTMKCVCPARTVAWVQRTSSPGTRMDPRYMTTFGWRSTRNSVASVCTSAQVLILNL